MTNESSLPTNVGSNDGLGLLPERAVFEPAAWYVYVPSAQHGYVCEDDDSQMVDDLTNTDATATPLFDQAAVTYLLAKEREACAQLVEARQDFKEEARAILAAAKALDDGDEDSTLRRLRHESMVRLMNNALAFAAADIRKRA